MFQFRFVRKKQNGDDNDEQTSSKEGTVVIFFIFSFLDTTLCHLYNKIDFVDFKHFVLICSLKQQTNKIKQHRFIKIK